VPELSPAVQARLVEILPAYASPRNPVDMTPTWARFAELYPACIHELARSGEVDAIVAVLLQRSALDPAVATAVVESVEELRAAGSTVAVYVCWVAPREAQPNADKLQQARIPCFEWPERTARAVGHAVRYGQARSVRPAPKAARRPVGLPELGPGPVGPQVAAEVVRAFGVEVVPQAVCAHEDEAAAAAARLGYPVVAKLTGEGTVHRSEVGGVRLGLGSEQELRTAVRDLLELEPGRLLIQRQASGVEVIVGGFRDPQAGPVVMVGLGGIFVEVLADAVFRLAPVEEEAAVDAIRSLRGYPVLAGARGRPAVDLGALAGTVASASRLMATMPEVSELDLNPLMCSRHGAVAVDIRVVTGGSSRTSS
ncbi:MAG TPA: acetate--CoA ligase family protein, partial [Actinomycetota bacterium]